MGVLEDLPTAARRRIKTGTAPRPFGAHFSAGEFALLQANGFEPLGQVMGVCVYRTGGQFTSGGWRNSDKATAAAKGVSYELTTSTAAFAHARQLAMQRMREEALQLGAGLVLGVRMERREIEAASEQGRDVWEFRARGTALRTTSNSDPVLSTLSATEFLQLREAGYRPLGIVIGNCNWLHIPSKNSGWLLTAWKWSRAARQNQELTDITQAMYQARELAIGRLEAEARSLRAAGVLGLVVEAEHLDPHHIAMGRTSVSYVTIPVALHYFALGTAVAGFHSKKQLVDRANVSLEQ